MIKITDLFKVNKGSKHCLEPKFQYYVHDDHNIVFIKKEPAVDIMKIPIDLFKIFCSSLVGATEIDYFYLDEYIDLHVSNTNNEYEYNAKIDITHISTLPKEKYELLMYKLIILKCKELILSKFPSNIDIKNKKLDKLFTLNHFYKLIPKLNRDAYDFDIIQDAIKTANKFDPEFIQNPFARSMVIVQNSEYLTRYYTISAQCNILSRLNSRITQVNSEWNLATKRESSFAQFSKDVQSKKDILIRETKDIILNCYSANDEYDLLVNDFQVMPNWSLKIRYDVIKK